MIDIVFGIHEDKWCAPLAVIEATEECAVTLEFYLPDTFNSADTVAATVIMQGRRYHHRLNRGKLTATGPFAVPAGGARLTIEFPNATRLDGVDTRVVGALLARILVNGAESAIEPPPPGKHARDRGFSLVAI